MPEVKSESQEILDMITSKYEDMKSLTRSKRVVQGYYPVITKIIDEKIAQIELEISQQWDKYYGILPEDPQVTVQDLSFGIDIREDEAVFIEARHINGWEIDQEVLDVVGEGLHFFRVLQDGVQSSSHGWIENGRIAQWG